MNKHLRLNPRYPDQHEDILNVAAVPWLKKRIKAVKKQGKKSRIAKYKNIDPFAFRIEYPVVFSLKKGYFRSTIVSRDNGLCFPDPKISFLTIDDLFQHLYKDDNESFLPDSDIFTNLELFESYVKDIETLPEKPKYIIVKNKPFCSLCVKTAVDFNILILSDSEEIDLDDLFATVFKGMRIQELAASVTESTDTEYPVEKPFSIDGYITGTLTVSDKTLTPSLNSINLFNVKLIKKLLTVYNPAYDGKMNYDGKYLYNGTHPTY